jgi:polyferredoxin
MPDTLLTQSDTPDVTPSRNGLKKHRKIVFKRLAVQLTFIIVHVALIKFAVPNIIWAVIGLLFWGGLIVAAAKSGRWVCATFCWLGGIQDLMYRWAKKRVNFNPKITQTLVLVLLFAWVPLAWMLLGSEAATNVSESPIQNPFAAGEESFVTQFGHFFILLLVGVSVMVLGSRGVCHYFCPFGTAVQFFRDLKLKRKFSGATHEPTTLG